VPPSFRRKQDCTEELQTYGQNSKKPLSRRYCFEGRISDGEESGQLLRESVGWHRRELSETKYPGEAGCRWAESRERRPLPVSSWLGAVQIVLAQQSFYYFT